MVSPSPRHAAEIAARDCFGRLVAYLSWRWKDVAAAEDAMADALLKALETWPVDGVPSSPEAWLLTVARRQLLQAARHDRLHDDPGVVALLEEMIQGSEATPFQDDRLRLMFVCAHPSIEAQVRIPLMLQTVLGLQVKDMAPALLVSPTALAQRLVRAKQRIRDSGITFEEPELQDMPHRLGCVLECIYGAFGLGVDAVDGAEFRVTDLREEAIHLCEILGGHLPEEPEVLGLRALMQHRQARRAARLDDQGRFVPLGEQDVSLWDRKAIVQADAWLWNAAQKRRPGPFQLEAAIQSAHSQRLFTGRTPWDGVRTLYEQINAHFPTHGSLVAGAVAMAETGRVEEGLRQLEAMDPAITKSFQPWWVAKAYLLSKGGPDRADVAQAAFSTAIGLTFDPRLKAHLQTLRGMPRRW